MFLLSVVECREAKKMSRNDEPGCLKVGDGFVACVSPLSTVRVAFPSVSCLQVK